ncbi:MAG: sigma-70 family RNA polymerase sigma factor [Planctomycetes bacterium]|nr:sigma-70 family RNA polymerase sigma factor [Planctomycetota bacterium]
MEPDALQANIRLARAGRPEGYQALLAAYGARLYGYFLRVTGNSHDAEDLLGEVMLRLVRTLHKYDERGRFEPWLFRIAANLIRDRFRRRKVAPVPLSLSGKTDGGIEVLETLQAPSPPADARLLAKEAGEQLAEALASLDETTRNMIVLRHFGEMSFAEIAKTMNCPLGTALAKVHRGLRALRGKLAPPD